MMYLLRFLTSSPDISGNCIVVHIVSGCFKEDEVIMQALQVWYLFKEVGSCMERHVL